MYTRRDAILSMTVIDWHSANSSKQPTIERWKQARIESHKPSQHKTSMEHTKPLVAGKNVESHKPH